MKGWLLFGLATAAVVTVIFRVAPVRKGLTGLA